jgi:hypothetical protein
MKGQGRRKWTGREKEGVAGGRGKGGRKRAGLVGVEERGLGG